MAIALNAPTSADFERSDAKHALELPSRPYQFTFSGNAREYFGIWSVNMALTLLTLGIYSAWAKVRTQRYFYGNTVLERSAFGYHALPMQILKGRLIALAAIIAYLVGVSYQPMIDFVVFLMLLPLVVPWIMVRALRFNRRVASYRHIHFDFAGTTGEAFVVNLLVWFSPLLTLGLLYPYAAYRLRRYVVEHSRFGRTEFRFEGGASGFYEPYAYVLGIGLALSVIAAGIVYSLHADLFIWLLAYPIDVVVLGLLVVMAPAFMVAAAYLKTRIENYAWCHTRLGSDRFELDLEFGRLLWIYLTNVLAVAASFGVMIPWAKVRLARYKLSRMSLLSVEGLDGHVAGERGTASATGEELGSALDLGLGV